MKLVSSIQPFMGLQSIHLYDDNNQKQEYRLAPLSNYAATVMQYLEDYPAITELDMHGADQFCQKIKDEIQANLITKYSNNKRIEVNIL
jgi:hypothetical protein